MTANAQQLPTSTGLADRADLRTVGYEAGIKTEFIKVDIRDLEDSYATTDLFEDWMDILDGAAPSGSNTFNFAGIGATGGTVAAEDTIKADVGDRCIAYTKTGSGTCFNEVDFGANNNEITVQGQFRSESTPTTSQRIIAVRSDTRNGAIEITPAGVVRLVDATGTIVVGSASSAGAFDHNGTFFSFEFHWKRSTAVGIADGTLGGKMWADGPAVERGLNPIWEFESTEVDTAGSTATNRKIRLGWATNQNVINHTSYWSPILAIVGSDAFVGWRRTPTPVTDITLNSTKVSEIDTLLANAITDGVTKNLRIYLGSIHGAGNGSDTTPTGIPQPAHTPEFRAHIGSWQFSHLGSDTGYTYRPWCDQGLSYWDKLCEKVAAQWDDHPALSTFQMSWGGLRYAEPDIRGRVYSGNQGDQDRAVACGNTKQLDLRQTRAAVASCFNHFRYTHTYRPHNPRGRNYDDDGTGVDTRATEDIMDYEVRLGGERTEMGFNGYEGTNESGNELIVQNALKDWGAVGVRVRFQTKAGGHSVWSPTYTIVDCLADARADNASLVELPNPYDNETTDPHIYLSPATAATEAGLFTSPVSLRSSLTYGAGGITNRAPVVPHFNMVPDDTTADFCWGWLLGAFFGDGNWEVDNIRINTPANAERDELIRCCGVVGIPVNVGGSTDMVQVSAGSQTFRWYDTPYYNNEAFYHDIVPNDVNDSKNNLADYNHNAFIGFLMGLIAGEGQNNGVVMDDATADRETRQQTMFNLMHQMGFTDTQLRRNAAGDAKDVFLPNTVMAWSHTLTSWDILATWPWVRTTRVPGF